MCLFGDGRTASVKGALCCTGEVLSHLVKKIQNLDDFLETMTPPPLLWPRFGMYVAMSCMFLFKNIPGLRRLKKNMAALLVNDLNSVARWCISH